jgi:hypothetical protein
VSSPEEPGIVFHDLGEYVDDASKFEARPRGEVTQVPPRRASSGEDSEQSLVAARAAKARWLEVIKRITEPAEAGRLRVTGSYAQVHLRSLQGWILAREFEVASDSLLCCWCLREPEGPSVRCLPWEDVTSIEFPNPRG